MKTEILERQLFITFEIFRKVSRRFIWVTVVNFWIKLNLEIRILANPGHFVDKSSLRVVLNRRPTESPQALYPQRINRWNTEETLRAFASKHPVYVRLWRFGEYIPHNPGCATSRVYELHVRDHTQAGIRVHARTYIGIIRECTWSCGRCTRSPPLTQRETEPRPSR